MAFLEDGTKSAEIKKDNLPQILLLGDSMRLGYCEHTKELLKDKFEVCYPLENCQTTQHTFVHLGMWQNLVGPEPVAVQFNCGHWDAAHWGGDDIPLNSPERYAEMLVRIVKRLQKMYPKTKIFFATSTPMNPNGSLGVNPRTTEDIIRYNKTAVEALVPLGVKINDLFAVTKDLGEEYYVDYVHLTKEGFDLVGKAVAKFFEENI